MTFEVPIAEGDGEGEEVVVAEVIPQVSNLHLAVARKHCQHYEI